MSKLDTDKKTPTMKIKYGMKQKKYQLIAKEFAPDFLRISLPPARSVKESAAHHLMVRTQQYVPSFLFDLESKAIPGFELEILSHDKKFMQSFQKIKVKFDKPLKQL
jgi:hypothetical protein